MNDKPKSALDLIARCDEIEHRLQKVEKQSTQVVETGSVSLVKDPILSKEGHGDKIVGKKILFEEPFKAIPKIFPSITAFNLDRGFEARLEVTVDSVTKNEAEITIRTWRESRAYYVRIEWLAIGMR